MEGEDVDVDGAKERSKREEEVGKKRTTRPKLRGTSSPPPSGRGNRRRRSGEAEKQREYEGTRDGTNKAVASRRGTRRDRIERRRTVQTRSGRLAEERELDGRCLLMEGVGYRRVVKP
jgi:hypothetical protein